MFDMAISGNGFFAIETPEGVQFTRNGNFAKSSEGILVTPMGFPVLDENGAQIAIPDNFQVPLVDGDGVVRGRDELTGEDTTIARLQVVDFPQIYDRDFKAQSPFQPVLAKSRNGLFIPQPGSTQIPAEEYGVAQGFLEEANVQPVLEMVKMIDVFRSYEADQKAIQIQDSTLERAVNDLGVVR